MSFFPTLTRFPNSTIPVDEFVNSLRVTKQFRPGLIAEYFNYKYDPTRTKQSKLIREVTGFLTKQYPNGIPCNREWFDWSVYALSAYTRLLASEELTNPYFEYDRILLEGVARSLHPDLAEDERFDGSPGSTCVLYWKPALRDLIHSVYLDWIDGYEHVSLEEVSDDSVAATAEES